MRCSTADWPDDVRLLCSAAMPVPGRRALRVDALPGDRCGSAVRLREHRVRPTREPPHYTHEGAAVPRRCALPWLTLCVRSLPWFSAPRSQTCSSLRARLNGRIGRACTAPGDAFHTIGGVRRGVEQTITLRLNLRHTSEHCRLRKQAGRSQREGAVRAAKCSRQRPVRREKYSQGARVRRIGVVCEWGLQCSAAEARTRRGLRRGMPLGSVWP